MASPLDDPYASGFVASLLASRSRISGRSGTQLDFLHGFCYKASVHSALADVVLPRAYPLWLVKTILSYGKAYAFGIADWGAVLYGKAQ